MLSLLSLLSFLMFFGIPAQAQSNYKPGLTATGISPDKVLLNWQVNMDGNYTAEVYLCSGGRLGSVENRGSYTVSGLDPSTEYEFKVKIQGKKGRNLWTGCATARTAPKRTFRPNN